MSEKPTNVIRASVGIITDSIGDGKGYVSSRDYDASRGVVPKQHSSGGDKQDYLGMSKRGNCYISL